MKLNEIWKPVVGFEEEKKAIKDCDTIFMCLENMMSKESANDYRSSYRLIKNLINNQQKEIEREKQYTDFYKDLCNKQQKEIEEKSTIIMAGAEKVKQLEKEIEELKAINQIQKYRIEVIDEREFISKDKIRDILKDLDEFDTTFFNANSLKEAIKNSLNELLEENDE